MEICKTACPGVCICKNVFNTCQSSFEGLAELRLVVFGHTLLILPELEVICSWQRPRQDLMSVPGQKCPS